MIILLPSSFEGPSDATTASKLDWCRVQLHPARDMDLVGNCWHCSICIELKEKKRRIHNCLLLQELFSSPTLLLEKLSLQFAHDKQGFALKGQESARAYADVLSHIHYFNLRPESFPHRSYTLQAS